MSRVGEYLHKSHILRQIQSNKANFYRKINNWQNGLIVSLSGMLTFFGFSGTDNVTKYANWFVKADKNQVELVFNLLVFLLFLLGILYLVFQFGRKQADSERAIVALANLANEIEDLLALEEMGTAVPLSDLNLVRHKYEALIQSIPSNTDEEFLRAKLDYARKEATKSELPLVPQRLFNPDDQEGIVRQIVSHSATVTSVLAILRDADSRLYLGGGLVRNAAWDFLHGYKHPTPFDDVDVIYFDELSATKQHDEELEAKLRAVAPNLKWSVKNQARMHLSNAESAYTSLEDAVSKWPETATAILCRLDEREKASSLHLLVSTISSD